MELVGKTISFSDISKVLFPLNLLMNHCTKAVCWYLTSAITKQRCRYTRDSLMSSYEIRKQYAIPCMKNYRGTVMYTRPTVFTDPDDQKYIGGRGENPYFPDPSNEQLILLHTFMRIRKQGNSVIPTDKPHSGLNLYTARRSVE